MKRASIFIAFGPLGGIIQGIINTLAGPEASKGLKGIVSDLPTYLLTLNPSCPRGIVRGDTLRLVRHA
jgi:hypothetical protein